MYEQGGNHLASILSVDKSVSTDLTVHVGVCINNYCILDADPHMYRTVTEHLKHGTTSVRNLINPMNRDTGLLPPVYDSLVRTHPPPDTHLCI